MDYDALIVGGGIGGMESALLLGDMGFKVMLVEKESSIGGKMILLSKVFPTLDCASCVSTPKMAATANHPNVDVLIYSEVDNITKNDDGSFDAVVHRKPTFVDLAKCTGCAQCETVCTVRVPDQFNANLIARRAAYIAFPQAVPKKSAIDRKGSPPCLYTCPAGVKSSGYVSLVRAGKYEEAFNLHMQDAPLPGVLSRACFAPCEQECSRTGLEGAVPIREIKRFMVDKYYGDHPEPDYGPPEETNGKKIAIIGSGPSGLAAAYFLAKDGYSTTIFEGDPEPGGIMRYIIPAYRLPKDIIDRDVKNVTALGVEIKTDSRVESILKLKEQGYDAVFLALGIAEGRKISIKGENLPGVHDCGAFLKSINMGKAPDLKNKKVVVIGGGNVAIDCARSAVRLGAADVRMACLEAEGEMPAHDWEVQQAVEEGVDVNCSLGPKKITEKDGVAVGIEFVGCTSIFNEEGKFSPTFDDSCAYGWDADVIIKAIGLLPNTLPFAKELELKANGTIKVDDDTLETSIPAVFAGGDAVSGPSMIVQAIGHGKRAAYYIDKHLKGESLKGLAYDQRLPLVDRDGVIHHAEETVTQKEAVEAQYKAIAERIKSFDEIEITMSEDEARYSANRCLDCGVCSQCQQCVAICPADAINFDMRDEYKKVNVGSVIAATGFNVFDAARKPALGFDRFPNVINAMQMDRILAPTRPYNSVIRPSDGKAPANIAYVMCTGSRDGQVDNRLCSRVCCMYSIKQAQLLMGALPLADITIYYIDIRAYGKGYDEFYEQARGMGVYFIKGKVARIEEGENQDLKVIYEDMEGEGGIQQAEHDLVVLSVGMLPNKDALGLLGDGAIEADDFNWVKEVDEAIEPGKTSVDGVFVAGTASAAKDIPDTILHAGATAAQVAAYLKKTRND